MTDRAAPSHVVAQRLLTIRPAVDDDVGAVREVARTAFLPYVPRIGREPEPMTADYAGLARAGRLRVGVAPAPSGEGRIVGFAALVPHPSHLVVESLAVAPGRQGRGVGAQLLLDAEAYAVAVGLREVRLCTNEAMTENLAYYARRGFAETHRAVERGFRRVFLVKQVQVVELMFES